MAAGHLEEFGFREVVLYLCPERILKLFKPASVTDRETEAQRDEVTRPGLYNLSLIHISEPTRQYATSRMPSSA